MWVLHGGHRVRLTSEQVQQLIWILVRAAVNLAARNLGAIVRFLWQMAQRAYKATVEFASWVRAQLRELLGRWAAPKPKPKPKPKAKPKPKPKAKAKAKAKGYWRKA